MLWIIFIVATFLIQITLMNLVIAIVGDIFDEVFKEKEKLTLAEQFYLLNRYKGFLSQWYKKFDARYLLVVKPVVQDSFENQLTVIKNVIEQQTKDIKENLDLKTQGTNRQILNFVEDKLEELSKDMDVKLQDQNEVTRTEINENNSKV